MPLNAMENPSQLLFSNGKCNARSVQFSSVDFKLKCKSIPLHIIRTSTTNCVWYGCTCSVWLQYYMEKFILFTMIVHAVCSAQCTVCAWSIANESASACPMFMFKCFRVRVHISLKFLHLVIFRPIFQFFRFRLFFWCEFFSSNILLPLLLSLLLFVVLT